MTAQAQAAAYHARQRKRGLRSLPDLHRTYELKNPLDDTILETAILTSAAFPDQSSPFTWHTRVSIGTIVGGLVFELGGSAGAAACWIETDKVGWRAGGATGGGLDAAAIYTHSSTWGDGTILDLVGTVIPGSGEVRLWIDGDLVAQDASDSPMPLWGTSEAGTFGLAALGALPTDVAETGAPNGFDVIAPFSIYQNQVPRAV